MATPIPRTTLVNLALDQAGWLATRPALAIASGAVGAPEITAHLDRRCGFSRMMER